MCQNAHQYKNTRNKNTVRAASVYIGVAWQSWFWYGGCKKQLRVNGAHHERACVALWDTAGWKKNMPVHIAKEVRRKQGEKEKSANLSVSQIVTRQFKRERPK